MKTIFDLDLLGIVKARTHLTIAAVTIWVYAVVMIFASINNTGINPALYVLMNTVSLGLIIWVVVAVVLLQVAMGIGTPTIVLTGIFSLVLPILVPLAVIAQATTVLKLAGAKTGFIGMSQGEKDKIRPGHCRGCGYSREGIGLLDPCPECTRVPQVI